MTRSARKYTSDERREAVSLAEEVGPLEASRRLGIPEGTVTYWRYAARKAAAGGRAWPELPEPSADEDGSDAELAAALAPKEAPPKHVARSYTPSERARALELIAEKGVTATSKELGISRFSLYDWQRRAKRAAAGEGDSPTSGPDPKDLAEQRDREILAVWHEHPGLGPSQVRNQLRRKSIKVSTATVRRVMEDAGYRPPKVVRRGHDERFESVRPNHCWHLDFVQRWIGRCSTFTLILIDDYSRFVVGHGVDDAERADLVIETFEAAITRHGKPEMVLHDKGSAFWSWNGISRFTRLLDELDVAQIVAEHKEWNGKVEVFNGNLHKELFDQQRFYDVGEMKRRLATHLHWYNHRRTHHALGGLLVPADRYHGRADEVLARIEAGSAADPNDALELRTRPLDLLRVTSTGGRPEVWLMGTKILG